MQECNAADALYVAEIGPLQHIRGAFQGFVSIASTDLMPKFYHKGAAPATMKCNQATGPI